MSKKAMPLRASSVAKAATIAADSPISVLITVSVERRRLQSRVWGRDEISHTIAGEWADLGVQAIRDRETRALVNLPPAGTA